MTPRLGVLLFLAAIGVMVVAAQSAGTPASANHTSSTRAAGGGGAPDATAAERGRRRRPGCGRFCRQAGGFGAGPGDTRDPVKVLTERVRVARDRIFGLRATCRLDRNCIGAILVNSARSPFVEYGRANLRIPAHTTRKVLVGITREGLRYLRRHGRDRHAFATVPLIYRRTPVSFHNRFTLLPPR